MAQIQEAVRIISPVSGNLPYDRRSGADERLGVVRLEEPSLLPGWTDLAVADGRAGHHIAAQRADQPQLDGVQRDTALPGLVVLRSRHLPRGVHHVGPLHTQLPRVPLHPARESAVHSDSLADHPVQATAAAALCQQPLDVHSQRLLVLLSNEL